MQILENENKEIKNYFDSLEKKYENITTFCQKLENIVSNSIGINNVNRVRFFGENIKILENKFGELTHKLVTTKTFIESVPIPMDFINRNSIKSLFDDIDLNKINKEKENVKRLDKKIFETINEYKILSINSKVDNPINHNYIFKYKVSDLNFVSGSYNSIINDNTNNIENLYEADEIESLID